ncbi:M15 family metallopeptidase [Actinoplanes sp. NEAU-A11]|uniref:M15 family metallopeptidase n=1 Tax=Actinoplanes aureus TaxID=2792083 RepID=A0A931G2N8_9ACTN|nr:M15 family metallopeptidase [Actinoplanes aureus]
MGGVGRGQRAHVVRPGDTLAKVAKRHGVRIADLREWNRLGKGYQLQVDGMLRLTAPATPLPAWRTRTETVTATEANGDPAKACPVQPSDLRRIWVRYIDYQGVARNGSLIMHRSMAVPTQRAFAKLYHWRFPIMVMQPIAVNMPTLTDKSVLTSGYECRYVAGTTTWSQHSYGLAVDVNPRQNPMIRGSYPNHTYLDPPNSATWLARERYWPGMVHAEGAARAFTANGFAWGGRWTTLLDYMHFSTTDR